MMAVDTTTIVSISEWMRDAEPTPTRSDRQNGDNRFDAGDHGDSIGI